MVGQWQILDNPECKLPQKLATAYTDLLSHIDGAGYTPLYYAATQLVSGTNHMIISKQVSTTQELEEHLVYVVLQEDTDGKFTRGPIEKIV